MKRYLLFILLLLPLVGKPCGWGDYTYYKYSFISQELIGMPEYKPFLYAANRTFHSSELTGREGNLRLWGELLKDLDKETIELLVYGGYTPIEKNIWENMDSKLVQACQTYIEFARNCSDTFAYRQDYHWDYDGIKGKREVDTESLLAQGVKLFKKEKNKQLKIRYAYQIIRIFHYSGRNKDGIEFFEKKVEGKFDENELYFYTLDQAGGCYYNEGNYEKAAYLYLKVFDKSMDRKESSFVSYNWCRRKGADGKLLLKGKEDQIASTLINSLGSFGDQQVGMEALFALSPTDERLKLLFMRHLSSWEGPILEAIANGENKTDHSTWAPDSLLAFAQKMYAIPRIKDAGFWRLMASYSAFLGGDIGQAKKELKHLTDASYIQESIVLHRIYTVLSWDKMTIEREQQLVEMYYVKNGDYWNSKAPVSGHNFVLRHLYRLYHEQGDEVKAFLVNSRAEELVMNVNMDLLDKLRAFALAPKNSNLEVILSNKLGGSTAKPTSYLDYIKAHYYLQAGMPEKALPLIKSYPTSSNMTSKAGITGKVSAKIFSNNTIECFRCDEDMVMKDSVYLNAAFSFIRPTFSRAEMAEYLVKLDSMGQYESGWKKNLANYLMGNYYFNICNTGFYREVLTGYHTNTGHKLFMQVSYYTEARSQVEIAMDYYSKVLENSSNRELNARCLYMMAKCELNNYYQGINFDDWRWEYYDGGVEAAAGYKGSFSELKTNYSDTRFYSQIIKECSFFRYYCSL